MKFKYKQMVTINKENDFYKGVRAYVVGTDIKNIPGSIQIIKYLVETADEFKVREYYAEQNLSEK